MGILDAKCPYWKNCKLFNEESPPCYKEQGYYYPEKLAGCARDFANNGEKALYYKKGTKLPSFSWGKFIWTSIVLIYIALIFYYATLPGEQVAGPIKEAAKWLHFIEFFGLALLLYLAGLYYDTELKLVIQGLLVMSIAIISEVIQMGVPGRTASYIDVMIDLAGAFSLYTVFLWLADIFYVDIGDLGGKR